MFLYCHDKDCDTRVSEKGNVEDIGLDRGEFGAAISERFGAAALDEELRFHFESLGSTWQRRQKDD